MSWFYYVLTLEDQRYKDQDCTYLLHATQEEKLLTAMKEIGTN